MRFPVVLTSSILLAACGGASPPASNSSSGTQPAAAQAASEYQITGTVLFDSPVRLSAGATLNLRLLDVTRADAEPTVVSTGAVPIAGLPAEFVLPYDHAEVTPIRGYAIDAQVLDQGTVKFVSMGRVSVLSQGKPSRVNVQLVQALTNSVRDPAVDLAKEFADFELRLGGLKRFQDSRIFGPEGKETAIGWDGFADETGVRMVREAVSDGEGNNRFTRRFAWKDGKLWFALRDQNGVKIRLGWDKDGTLLIKERNGTTDESVADEAAGLSRAAREAYDIANARKPG